MGVQFVLVLSAYCINSVLMDSAKVIYICGATSVMKLQVRVWCQVRGGRPTCRRYIVVGRKLKDSADNWHSQYGP